MAGQQVKVLFASLKGNLSEKSKLTKQAAVDKAYKRWQLQSADSCMRCPHRFSRLCRRYCCCLQSCQWNQERMRLRSNNLKEGKEETGLRKIVRAGWADSSLPDRPFDKCVAWESVVRHKTRLSPDLESLKLWKGRSYRSGRQSSFHAWKYVCRPFSNIGPLETWPGVSQF